MPSVTSLSVVLLLLALCPLDVAGQQGERQVMFLKENRTISVIDLTTDEVRDRFTTNVPVSAMDYDPVSRMVYWCGFDKSCYVQGYDGSSQTPLFDTEETVRDMHLLEGSTLYYLDAQDRLFKYEGEEQTQEGNATVAFTLVKSYKKAMRLTSDGYITDSSGSVRLENGTSAISLGETLFYVVNKNSSAEIRALGENGDSSRIIVKDFQKIGYLSVIENVIVFAAVKPGENKYNLYTVNTDGSGLKKRTENLLSGFTTLVPFQAAQGPVAPASPQFSPQANQAVFNWTPKIGCLQTNVGTTIKVSLETGLEDFSLLVMDPPQGCSRDLGQFRQDITVPESCVRDKEVEVAVQLTEIKDILGGRFFRHFLFSCSELGPDGKAVELTTDSNPDKTQATASNTSYADGSFSLMVVTSANLNGDPELTSASSVLWSQKDIFLVLCHRLATGSQHRTLIPAECTISSTSHPAKKTLWLSKPEAECKQEKGLIDAWTIHSERTDVDDVTFTQLFPFDFKVGEEVTITCDARECPYVAETEQLQGRCLEAFQKYQSCGGTFRNSSDIRRREVTSLAGNGSASWDQVATRVMSASFTLV